MMRKNKSKKFAMYLAGATIVLAGYALKTKQGDAGAIIFGSGIGSAVALYANKQHQDRKWGELEQYKEKENGC